MIFSRTSIFLISLVVVITPFLLPKLIWLSNSEKAIGTMRFVGKSYTGQLIHVYSEISFPAKNDTFWFNSNDNTVFNIGEKVPVRYQKNDPTDARVSIFSNIWSDTVIYGSGPVIILLLVFFHPKGISRSFRLRVSSNRPYIKVV
ncbi:MAG: hypothetical protein JSS70_06810 [Bacteroidetes bacterium]|nr:hypothetical protein [Bacteroidota bacterium]